MSKLVLIRHGESIWNKKNIFTGWTDIKLSKNGILEAKNAGLLLKKNNFNFQYAYSSLLKRSIHTLWEILYKLDLLWIKVIKNWRLNERHYGNLQGYNKKKITIKYGEKKVNKWRRSYKSRPPKMNLNNKKYIKKNIKYKNINNKYIPLTESLEDTYNRLLILWKNNIINKIKKNYNIIIVAHGNSLRALIKYLDKISDENIEKLNIPTGIPIIYKFKNKNIIKKYYLYK